MREKDFDIDGFLNVLAPFYKGGDYDFLLNSDKELDLTGKRFIVFELDNISGNKVLLPVVTLIIMETFIAKMRRLKGILKDAQAQGEQQDDFNRGMMEGPDVRQYE